MTPEQKIENIKTWLTRNRDERVADNDYLTAEQTAEITTALTALIEALTHETADETIEKGNATLFRMNTYVNEERERRLPTLEKFLEVMYSEKNPENGKFVMGTIDDILDLELYDKAIEYITAVDVTKVRDHGGTMLCMLTGSNPISPLLRPIPKKEDVELYQAKRYEYFQKVKQHYVGTNQQSLADCIRVDKPENYDKKVKEYDMLYIGGAPKR